jgi:DNA-binding MarR family transcriptional regulator
MAITRTGDAPAAPVADVAEQLIEVVVPLLAQQRRKWAQRCQAHGLSIVGVHALALLEEAGPMPMSRLADELDVSLPNASGIVGRLAERGLVERGTDPDDRRIVRAGLSAHGRALLGEMEAARIDRLRRLVAALDERAQRRLLASVNDLLAAVEAISTTENA